MDGLPLEIIEYIGRRLSSWDDIWSFTIVFKRLRKVERFARYARCRYLRDQLVCYKTLDIAVPWADDRCRHYSFGDGRVWEHWRVKHPWIDYNIDPETYDGLPSNKMWCIRPFGCIDKNGEYESMKIRTYDIITTDTVCMFYEDITRLPTNKQNRIKEKYDNIFKRSFIKQYVIKTYRWIPLEEFDDRFDFDRYSTYDFSYDSDLPESDAESEFEVDPYIFIHDCDRI